MPVLDFSQMSEPIPSGTYRVEIIKVEERPSNKGNFSNFFWDLLIVEGDCAGQKFQMCTTAKPDGMFLLHEALIALGEDLSSKQFEFDPHSYIGMEMVVDVKTRVYEGRERPQVAHCHKIG